MHTWTRLSTHFRISRAHLDSADYPRTHGLGWVFFSCYPRTPGRSRVSIFVQAHLHCCNFSFKLCLATSCALADGLSAADLAVVCGRSCLAMSAADLAVVAGGVNALMASSSGNLGGSGQGVASFGQGGSASRGRTRSPKRPNDRGRSCGHGGSKSRGRSCGRGRRRRSSSSSSYSSSYSSVSGQDALAAPVANGWGGKFFNGVGLGKRSVSLGGLPVSAVQEALYVYDPAR